MAPADPNCTSHDQNHISAGVIVGGGSSVPTGSQHGIVANMGSESGGQSATDSAEDISSIVVPCSHDKHATARNVLAASPYMPVHKFNFVEACCGPNSVLSSAAHFGNTYQCTRITAEHDFASEHGMQLALDNLHGPGDILWLSTPCTGGCRFQIINRRRCGPATVAKLDEHIKSHKRLWTAATKVASIAISRGCTVIIEWPKACLYWRDKSIRSFLHRHHFHSSFIDGCKVGLFSVRAKMCGSLLRKQWRLECSDIHLANALRLECTDRSHGCVSVEGADTKHSENYSRLFATFVHRACHTHSKRCVTMGQADSACNTQRAASSDNSIGTG